MLYASMLTFRSPLSMVVVSDCPLWKAEEVTVESSHEFDITCPLCNQPVSPKY